jgi:hypothetical protein
MASTKITIDLDLETLKAKLDDAEDLTKKGGKKAGESFAKGFQRSAKRIFEITIGNFLALQLQRATAAMSGFAKNTIRDAKDLENSLTGLRSVAGAMGQEISKVEDIAKRLSEDGLIPLADSTSALKNILATGIDADTAEKALLALRDAAAFNRQGQLSLGQAVRGATEGIKNQNSIMVDNAGVTKNLSLILKEYATSVGKSVASLGEQEKKQAIVNGIIKEAALFQGDYNKLLDTFSGATTKAAGQSKFLSAELGKLLTESGALTGFFKGLADQIKALRKFLNENNDEVKKFVNEGLVDLVAALQKAVGWVVDLVKGVRILGLAMEQLQLAMHDPIQSWKIFRREQKKILEENLLGGIKNGLDFVKRSMIESANAAQKMGQDTKDAGDKMNDTAEEVRQNWNFTGVHFAGVSDQMAKDAKTLSASVNRSLGQGFVNAFASVGAALVNGENAFEAFGRAVLSSFGDILIMLGTQAIFASTAMIAAPLLFGLQGAAGVAAGLALITAGGALKAFAGGAGGGASAAAGGGVAAGGGGGFEGGELDTGGITEVAELERETPGTTVTVNVQGNILDRRETGLEIAEVINETFGSNGVVITQAV